VYAETTLLNVDLDLWSRTPLDDLVRAFGRRVFVLHAGREGRRYAAHLELATNGRTRDADTRVRDFVALVRKLPPASRKLWNQASTRDFNIGIQAAANPFSYELALAPGTVRAAAEVDARIVMTIYGADSTASRSPTVRRRSR
jgi:hypothetical protein